jgi:hypothetical protein
MGIGESYYLKIKIIQEEERFLTALALVLEGGDGALLPPVDGLQPPGAFNLSRRLQPGVRLPRTRRW